MILGRTSKPGITCVKIRSLPLHVLLAADHPLARKQRLRLLDLKKTPLAAPEDLRYCRTMIADHLQARGVQPAYRELDPSLESHRAFLEHDRGALFVIPDQQLQTLYPAARMVPIAAEDLMTVPLCFAYASDSKNTALRAIERHLTTTAAHTRDRRRP